MTIDASIRYGRHLCLPEVGPAGQARLGQARVLLVGLGGLGSPLALYLAAAGVGTLGLVEFDRVELSNLQRQILYASSEVGQAKLEVAQARLSQLNPQVQLRAYPQPLSAANALEIAGDYDLIVDGSDNFSTRYLCNDLAFFLGKPLISASVQRFQGQLAVFHPTQGGPCYRCLYPEPPPPELAPNCAQAGVLGVVPGILGTLQANEVLKWILGLGPSPLGRLLLFDALQMQLQPIGLFPDPRCRLCGAQPSITDLSDHLAACGEPLELISAEQLQPERHNLLDVRQDWEVAQDRLPSLHIPWEELAQRFQELDPQQSWVIYCHSGARSAQACRLLSRLGFARVCSLEGGLVGYRNWARAKPPVP